MQVFVNRQLSKWGATALFFISFFLLCLMPSWSAAQGDLLIFPKRLVFEDNNMRSQTLNLTNNGKDSAVYTLSFVEIRMNEDGTFERIDEPDPGQHFASPYLRFFPRRVSLAPKESQTVKVQRIRSSQLGEQEYRSHLYFRAVPDNKTAARQAERESGSGISVQLKPVYGITIPMIIRQAGAQAQVHVDHLELVRGHDNQPQLNISFWREGAVSTYGNLRIRHISTSGVTTELRTVKGLGIYTPGARRHTSVLLDPAQWSLLSKGKLEVLYYKNIPGRATQQLAEAVLPLR